MMIYVWLGIFILALVIELSTTQLVSIWFSGSAIIALILAIIGVPWYIQVIVFVASSVALVLATRPLYEKLTKNKASKTNSDAIVGSEIIALSDCNIDTLGEAKIRDVVWSIAVDENITISTGEKIVVKEIKGNKLIVTKKG